MSWSRWIDFGIALFYTSLGNSIKKNMNYFTRNYTATDKKDKNSYIHINTNEEKVKFGYTGGHSAEYNFKTDTIDTHLQGNKYNFDINKNNTNKEINTKISDSRGGIGLIFNNTQQKNQQRNTLDKLVNILLGIKEVYVETNNGYKIPIYIR